jgi:hypothetical protein
LFIVILFIEYFLLLFFVAGARQEQLTGEIFVITPHKVYRMCSLSNIFEFVVFRICTLKSRDRW